MDKIRNLSVRKTILLYITVSLLCNFLLSAAVVKTAQRAQERIWWKYADKELYFEMLGEARRYVTDVMEDGEYIDIMMGEARHYMTDIPRPAAYEMTRSDLFLSEICDFLETYTILILSIAGSCGAVFLFYRNKLKRPIEELERASKNIAGNNLDFCITYENRDEMGILCRVRTSIWNRRWECCQKVWHRLSVWILL